MSHVARLRDLDITVLIPVKSPVNGKSRLNLTPAERQDASWALVENTVQHLASLEPILLVNDVGTSAWLEPLGRPRWIVEGSGLNHTVTEAYRRCRSRWVLVVHSDLAHPELMIDLEVDTVATIWPDQHGSGTPLFLLPSGLDWVFAYGPRSRHAHEAALGAAGVPFNVREGSLAAVDIDTSADYRAWRQRLMEGAEAPSINP